MMRSILWWDSILQEKRNGVDILLNFLTRKMWQVISTSESTGSIQKFGVAEKANALNSIDVQHSYSKAVTQWLAQTPWLKRDHATHATEGTRTKSLSEKQKSNKINESTIYHNQYIKNHPCVMGMGIVVSGMLTWMGNDHSHTVLVQCTAQLCSFSQVFNPYYLLMAAWYNCLHEDGTCCFQKSVWIHFYHVICPALCSFTWPSLGSQLVYTHESAYHWADEQSVATDKVDLDGKSSSSTRISICLALSSVVLYTFFLLKIRSLSVAEERPWRVKILLHPQAIKNASYDLWIYFCNYWSVVWA